jgi:CHAT domain-containing protein
MRSSDKILLLLLFSILLFNVSLGNNGINKYESLPQTDSVQLLLDMANASVDAGNYDNALALAKRVHQLRLQTYSQNDPKIVMSYINMSFIYIMVTDYDSAQYFLDKAEELYTTGKISEGPELSDLYSNMGLVNRYKGDYLQAEEYCTLAEEYYKKFNSNLNTDDMVTILLRLANVERLLKKHEAALNYYQECIRLLEKMKNNKRLLVTCYTGIANVYSDLKIYSKSIELQKLAIKLARSDSSNNALRLGLLYSNLGNDYLKSGQIKLSEVYLQSALIQYNFLEVKGTNLVHAFDNLGRLYEKQNDYSKALSYYQKALGNIAPGFQPTNYLSNPSKEEIYASPILLTILKSKINCLNASYQKEANFEYLEAAINTSLLAIESIEQMRNTYQSYESKLQIANDEYLIYMSTISLLRKAYEKTGKIQYGHQAFAISEKSKSAILLSSLREMNALEFAGIPVALVNEEKKLSRHIALYKDKIYEEKQERKPDAKKIRTWEEYLYGIQQKHNKLIRTFETNYPKYYELKYNNDVIKVSELQKLLPGNTTILEYSLDNSVLDIFAISRNSFVFQSIKIDSTFNKTVTSYIDKFHKFDFSRQSYSDYTQFCWNSNTLYNTLIKPVKSNIRTDNLIIVPDGALSFLPFETLIEDLPEDMPATYYKALRYMLYDYNISYTYSSALFCQDNQVKKKDQDIKLLAFAPEYSTEFDADTYRTRFITRQKFRRELFPIPGVIDEVNEIKNLIHSDIFVGSKATEREFRSIVGNYDIIHLAMHAVIDNIYPLHSKLIFTLDSDTLEDGLLNTYEIFGLQLNARMVVLSACNTAEGDYAHGEGVMSLARGFVYAGSPSLVMTMWEVEDKSGSILMKSFYENLLEGQSKAEALRNAKISYLESARPENIHPFFWSSFVVLGNTQPLFNKKKSYLPIEIGLLIGFLIIILGVRMVRKFRKGRSF